MKHMFWNDKKTQSAIFNFLIKNMKYDQHMNLIQIDFQKPWWDLFLKQKGLVLLCSLNIVVLSIISTLAPFWLAQVFVSNNVSSLIVLISALIFSRVLNFGLFYFDPLFRIQSIKSIENSANNFFLAVDPIFHTLRSTGQIVAKVTRGSNSIDSLVDILQFSLLSTLGSIIGVIVAFLNVDFFYAIWVGLFLFFLIGFNAFSFVLRTKLFKKLRIQTDDASKAASLEILQQAQYIRAVFASKEQFHKVSKLQRIAMFTHATFWRVAAYITSSTQIMFLFSLMLVSIWLVKRTDIDKVITVALLLSYYQIGDKIQAVGNSVSRSIQALEDVTDFYDFMRNFGTQTFPVLDSENLKLEVKKLD